MEKILEPKKCLLERYVVVQILILLASCSALPQIPMVEGDRKSYRDHNLLSKGELEVTRASPKGGLFGGQR